jgi:hypothetical protein
VVFISGLCFPAKLESNKNWGWIHVFFDKGTLKVKNHFINRGAEVRPFPKRISFIQTRCTFKQQTQVASG